MPKTSFVSFSQLLQASLNKNRYFFWAFFCFLLIGGIALLFIDKGDLLLFFSSNRTPARDFLFKNATKLGEEYSYIFLLFLFLFIRFRFALLIPIIGGIVTIISFISKSFFLHPRPSVFYKNLGTFNDINIVDGVYVVGGLSSFPSGHTMSGFALFTLIALLARNKKQLGLFLFSLALIIGLSRVYLVQHFFEDIYLGGLMGVLIALLVFNFQLKYPFNEKHWIDQKIEMKIKQK